MTYEYHLKFNKRQLFQFMHDHGDLITGDSKSLTVHAAMEKVLALLNELQRCKVEGL
jgi:hypothetical protein